MWPAEKKAFNQEQFRERVEGLQWVKWRPSRIVWHNTAAPSLAQWIKSAREDEVKGLVPGTTRIGNLENYFWKQNGWSGCPHLFIANDFIWEMNRLTDRGVHSPSYNTTAIGIEMVGDFSREDDDAGEGLKVRRNTIFATAVLCSALGLDPAEKGVVLLHKEDPRTTHDCPGEDVARDKGEMVREVIELMDGGEHEAGAVEAIVAGAVPQAAATAPVSIGTVSIDGLNFRAGPGVGNGVIGELNKGVGVEIIGSARNGATEWLRVKTPAGYIGWVAGRFIAVRSTKET